jgi:hypothetical protein
VRVGGAKLVGMVSQGGQVGGLELANHHSGAGTDHKVVTFPQSELLNVSVNATETLNHYTGP